MGQEGDELMIINCIKVRELLSFSQAELAKELGWKDPKQVSNIENGVRPMQVQTELAIECLLRRKGLWSEFNSEK